MVVLHGKERIDKALAVLISHLDGLISFVIGGTGANLNIRAVIQIQISAAKPNPNLQAGQIESFTAAVYQLIWSLADLKLAGNRSIVDVFHAYQAAVYGRASQSVLNVPDSIAVVDNPFFHRR